MEGAAAVAALDPNSSLRQDYELAAQINTKSAWQAFLKNYPNGFYADLARAALIKLDTPTPQVASTSPEQRNLSSADRAQPSPGSGPALDAFVGKSFRIGSKAIAHAVNRDGRCMMIMLDPDTAEKTPAVLKAVAQEHEGMAGIYAAILVEGMIRKGDPVELL